MTGHKPRVRVFIALLAGQQANLQALSAAVVMPMKIFSGDYDD